MLEPPQKISIVAGAAGDETPKEGMFMPQITKREEEKKPGAEGEGEGADDMLSPEQKAFVKQQAHIESLFGHTG